VDLLAIKGRLALALVESIFRRAGITVTPVGPLEVPPHLGREDLPDFAARRDPAVGAPDAAWTRLIEVRYRLDLTHYLAVESQRGARSTFTRARRQWPALLVVFVSDHPEPGRSCFQAVDLGAWVPGEAIATTALWAPPELAIYRQNVEEHELLLRRMSALLSGV